MRCLNQVLVICRQIYPASECPTGHIELIRTYQSMCTIAYAQKNFVRVLEVGDIGLDACRTLHPNRDDAETNMCESLLHSTVASACTELDDLEQAREHYLQAAEIHRLGLNDDPDGRIHERLACTLDSLAHVHIRLGDPRTAAEYASRALATFQPCLQRKYSIKDQRELARLLSSHSTALRQLGKYQQALALAKQSHDISFRVFLVSREPEDEAQLIRTLIDQGILHQNIGDLDSAYRRLDAARQILENDQNTM